MDFGDSSSDDSAGSMENDAERKAQQELRRKYRKKKQELQDNRDALANNSRNLNNELEEVNDLFSRVTTTREAVLDSDTIRCIASIGKNAVQAVDVNLVTFQPLEYAERLITFMQGDHSGLPNGEIPKEGWDRLGATAAKCFATTPTFHFMLGTFERGEVTRKERSQRAPKEKDNPAATVRPQEVKQTEPTEQEETTEEVERILAILHEWYEKNDRSPIDYFEFVINPDSFGLTVGNMFHVSFLIKDGAAMIYLDENELPVIEPIFESEEGPSQARAKSNQVVMSLNYKQWKEIVSVFKIKKPLIPPREKPCK